MPLPETASQRSVTVLSLPDLVAACNSAAALSDGPFIGISSVRDGQVVRSDAALAGQLVRKYPESGTEV